MIKSHMIITVVFIFTMTYIVIQFIEIFKRYSFITSKVSYPSVFLVPYSFVDINIPMMSMITTPF